MFDFIGKIKNKIARNTDTDTATGSPMGDNGDLWTHMVKKGCPDCKTHPMSYMEGPSGGMSTNVKCAECGSNFNITPALGIAERI